MNKQTGNSYFSKKGSFTEFPEENRLGKSSRCRGDIMEY